MENKPKNKEDIYMLKQIKSFRITEVEPKLLDSFYKVMISIRDLYATTPQPVVQVSVIQNQEEGISVELTTLGKQAEFNDLCKVYENLFDTLDQIS